jgi:hypothetical protein
LTAASAFGKDQNLNGKEVFRRGRKKLLTMLRRCPLCRNEFDGDKCPECSGDADTERLMHDAFRRFFIEQDWEPMIEPDASEDLDDPVDREREWDDE